MEDNKGRLLWLDLETTGLDPYHDKILELAFIISDWDFNIVERGHFFVHHQSLPDLESKHPELPEFWKQRPTDYKYLREQCLESATDTKMIEGYLCVLLDKLFGHNTTVYLAGNSIAFDRSFIKNKMPKLDQRLHYRMLDVSAVKLVAENICGLHFAKQLNHRAESDIEESMYELDFYLTKGLDNSKH